MDPESARMTMEVRDMAATYELWCFFEVIEAAEHTLGVRASLVEETASVTNVGVQNRSSVDIGAVRIIYNQTFSASSAALSRSYSVPLRPDIAVRTSAGTWHLFDAKCKLDVGRAMQEMSEDDVALDRPTSFQSGDVHKMHAYRDALGAQSVWVLYPGSTTSPVEFAWDGQRSIKTAPNGVGAIPLRPGASADGLRSVMRRVLSADAG
jgi:predicted component of viral defense system (DUF524 family)